MKDEENIIDIEENDVEFVDLDDAGDEKSLEEKLKDLRIKLKEKEKEAKVNLDGWQRARAEMVNKEKQMQDDRTSMMKFANQNLLEEIIPTFDNFEMAKRNKEIWEKVDQNWRVGVEYIFTNLKNVVKDAGLEEISPRENDEFSTSNMESTEEVETTEDTNDHKVAELVQTGYTLNGKLLRPAKVKIYIKK